MSIKSPVFSLPTTENQTNKKVHTRIEEKIALNATNLGDVVDTSDVWSDVSIQATSSEKYSDLAQETSFAALCAAICHVHGSEAQSDFPLRGRLRMRSQITPSFHPRDFSLEQEASAGIGKKSTMPTARLAFLTLAGVGGALPWWISEKILWDRSGAGAALHAFLDLLNRRFWELLFLSQSVGSNPQYGFHNSYHAQLLSSLSHAIVGLGHDAIPSCANNKAAILHRVKQYCWGSGGGTSGVAALSELLTDACGSPVSLREHHPLCLPVGGQSQLFLGPGIRNRLSSITGVIGAKAWVFCALVVTVCLSNSDDLSDYLPPLEGDKEGGRRLNLLREILDVFYVQNLPPVMLQIEYLSGTSFSCLGSRDLRLGLGAALAGTGAVAQIVRFSVPMPSLVAPVSH